MLIDSHCHLPGSKYAKDTETLILEAKAAGVVKLINIGTSFRENVLALEVSSKYPDVYSAIGIYPHEERELSISEIQQKLQEQLKSSQKIVAVGECGYDIGGLDWERPVKEQRELFEIQLDLAVKNNLPIAIHNRGGDEIIMETLDKFVSQGLKGVAHCFSSTQKVADAYLERGFYLSFSAMITYKGRDELREVAKNVPLEKFLFETDAPYLPPTGFRGKPNEPRLIVETAKTFAEVRGMPFEKVAEFSYSNTCNLFGISA